MIAFPRRRGFPHRGGTTPVPLCLRSTPVGLDERCCPLADHERWSGQNVKYLWHNGRIGDSQPSDTVYPQFRVHHGHVVRSRAHFAGSCLMILWSCVLAHGAAPVLVARELIPRASRQRSVAKRHIVFLQGASVAERQGYLNTLDENSRVHWVAQIISVDQGLLERIVASQPKSSWHRNRFVYKRSHAYAARSVGHESTHFSRGGTGSLIPAEKELKIGMIASGVRGRENAGRHGSSLEGDVLQSRRPVQLECVWHVYRPGQRERHVILKRKKGTYRDVCYPDFHKYFRIIDRGKNGRLSPIYGYIVLRVSYRSEANDAQHFRSFLRSGTYLVPRPTFVTHRCPVVVILGVPPRVHHPVVNRRAAEVLASWPAAGSSGRQTGVALVHGPILPVDRGALPLVNISVVEGKPAELPCDITPPGEDTLHMVFWFKDEAGVPLYT
ncbi:hypothetical protein WN48_07805 [Eufriesea mexicana]|uniref:Ig-like domain-containing protein n=1 Tax=Eufriesea mexicana TaxID=516756 RepID=A0A310SG55_9HYME|nr:hypothetical protein WN48_07805 [Eufriesea mexicana]